MLRGLVVVTCAFVLAGCPGPKRSTLPKNGDKDAYARFKKAHGVFLRDGGGLEDFVAIVDDYPGDPIVPWANLYTGITKTTARDFSAAEATLREVATSEDADPFVRKKARMWLGIAQNYQGRHADAVGNLAGTKDAIENDRERGEWLAAMAIARAGGDQPLDGLGYFDQWYAVATPAERGFILARLGELAISATPEAAREAHGDLDDGPARAVLAYRVAADVAAGGDADKAKRIRDGVAGIRRELGLPLSASAGPAPGGGDPGLVGAILPLTGPRSRVGELAAQGLAVASGATGTGAPGVVTVDVRSVTSAVEAAAAVDLLATAGAIGVLGPMEAEAVDAAANRVNAIKLPMLSLSAAPEQRIAGRWVFHVMHPAPQRARLLAREAAARGVKQFAVLYPDNGYGRAVKDAFVAALTELGGTVVKEEMYPKDTKSFSKITKDLGKQWQGVFVADNADALALIAPALAANDHVPRPVGAAKPRGEPGRSVLLVSTAEGLMPDYQATRHSAGALLAPGFYPDEADPAIGAFVKSYTAGVGKPPSAVDAYAYDAAQAIATSGAAGRADLAARLDKLARAGVTGTMRFDAETHLRADDGIVFTVLVGGTDTAPTHEIRAIR
jgi:ABC-type branched-subunit amino acid transport system substrate-binding protein